MTEAEAEISTVLALLLSVVVLVVVLAGMFLPLAFLFFLPFFMPGGPWHASSWPWVGMKLQRMKKKLV